MRKWKPLKTSEGIALGSAAVGLLIGIPLAAASGLFGVIVGCLVAGGLYNAGLKQIALERVVDAKSLADKD